MLFWHKMAFRGAHLMAKFVRPLFPFFCWESWLDILAESSKRLLEEKTSQDFWFKKGIPRHVFLSK